MRKLPQPERSARLAERGAFWVYYGLATTIAIVVICGGYFYSVHVERQTGESFDYFTGLQETMHDLGQTDVNIPTLVRVSLRRPIYLLILLYAGAPTLAAMIVLSWRGGAMAVVQLFGRLRPWLDPASRRGSLYCYASIVGLHLALMAGLRWGSWLLTDQHVLDDQKGFAPGAWWLISLLIGTFLREGGALEELGWRGFGLPTLLRSGMAPLSASILLGVLWSVWHIPRDAMGPMQSLAVSDYLWNFSQFTAACLSLSILMTWCFHLTAGSALPAVMIHGLYVHLSSFVSPAAGYGSAFDVRVLFYAGAALFAVVWTRGRLGQDEQLPQVSEALR